jgi:hypothetical protein
MIKIREHRPGFVDGDELRESIIEDIMDIYCIPWLKDRGTFRIDGRYVLTSHGRYIVATISEVDSKES